MNPRRKKRLLGVVAIVFGIGAAIGLVLYALQENINLFYTPSELIEGKGPDKEKPHIGQKLRIGGMVVPGSVIRDETSLQVSFTLIDTGPLVTIKYQGILPDLFREGQGIVAQGVLIEPNVIEAFEVLAKHDEEYMPAEVAEAVKGIKHEKPKYNLESGN
ncbi:MAG: cytochrome c-type biogenesis protein CcmE [Pseudoalteromonas rhizosphaerae]|mgnify:CR=1 FL=1|jgi:cytochrome c-type biogenesis protein CcmE|uniref:Cytochrome c-type biogenesis protein CcmE n=1 Tax=Pseudoalteromonas neustonica TaxID=1840331 RepID=A0ABY3FBU8_9GAMM|nr:MULTISPECIES: cytochrome c maturation protein CcmE [Pseudoalteromonas]MBB1293621.1 cytochrome c maturation protein CcmE [Pseudoalteromonas sp. SR41-4]MBB1300537.1 cytochrome c maturation protein CcmE [Pseudoalteromonas sp. SR44-8]MBB1309531.1 cytochrome c maturation protein CcmE [Pseudoalteromonas sp. SR41-8]MBB1397607.1 cytochrome c maturation protein CcmE [Pseudoalteromonas sp. SG44-8]MBB1409260.1 cytochrome c maturation protein CcmE [Pseudoalteromonas sp. SG44-17]|tara:strand:- start:15648 stop:16127 length:480 start_codon:yes stop_codon:yes gene_type:complete